MTFIAGRITIDDKVLNGKPAIRGMRIAVETILEFLSAGQYQRGYIKSISIAGNGRHKRLP